MNEPQPWDGVSDRRSIPIHILNYVDGRLEEHTKRIYDLLQEHVSEEMERYDEILDKIGSSADKAEARHNSLSMSINSYMTKQELIEEAFLEDKHGKPDYHGHKYDHEYRKQVSSWWAKVKDGVVMKIIEWGGVAFVAWAGYALWDAFLRGPHDHP